VKNPCHERSCLSIWHGVNQSPGFRASLSKVVARDVVFLLDRSGSMNGLKMTSAARALIILLNTLRPDDRFAICAFDNSFEWLESSVGSTNFSLLLSKLLKGV
jgi:secreted protein with Ig-like and vWFA domain